MVTVLMATWQGAEYLPEQLESILNQTVPVARIVVSDDGSDDATLTLLEQYKQEFPDIFTILHHLKEEDAGSLNGAAANFFFLAGEEVKRLKTGETSTAEDVKDSAYWFLSDQDDIWLRKQVAVMPARR